MSTILSIYSKFQSQIEKYTVVPSSPALEAAYTEIAKEVIAGKWGNGMERKMKLHNAGYDYATVQKLVNKLLS